MKWRSNSYRLPCAHLLCVSCFICRVYSSKQPCNLSNTLPNIQMRTLTCLGQGLTVALNSHLSDNEICAAFTLLQGLYQNKENQKEGTWDVKIPNPPPETWPKNVKYNKDPVYYILGRECWEEPFPLPLLVLQERVQATFPRPAFPDNPTYALQLLEICLDYHWSSYLDFHLCKNSFFSPPVRTWRALRATLFLCDLQQMKTFQVK